MATEETALHRHVEKPRGHGIRWAATGRHAAKMPHVRAGHRPSLQFHEHKDETSDLRRGRLVLPEGASADDLAATAAGEGSRWRNRPGEVHAIEALEHPDVLEVSTPHLDDVVRLSDGYGREGTSAP